MTSAPSRCGLRDLPAPDVPDAATAAARAVHLHHDVSELTREAIRAVQQLAAAHDRTAHAGRDGEVDEVVEPLGGTKCLLSQRRDIGVAIEERRQALGLREGGGQVDVPELGPEVGRLYDDAVDGVDGTGR